MYIYLYVCIHISTWAIWKSLLKDVIAKSCFLAKDVMINIYGIIVRTECGCLSCVINYFFLCLNFLDLNKIEWNGRILYPSLPLTANIFSKNMNG